MPKFIFVVVFFVFSPLTVLVAAEEDIHEGISEPSETESKQEEVHIAEQVKLNFKESMIPKGFFFDFPQNDFTFIVRPNGIKYPTLVDAKKITLENARFPSGMALVGERIYEYEMYSPMAFNHKIALEFELRGSDFVGAMLHYWDFSQNAWVVFPQENQSLGEDGVLRGKAYATRLRLAVLKDDSRHWGEASWYAYKDCDCAASPFYSKGTKMLVTHLYNNKQVVVTINDFGPELDVFPNRIIDLDRVAFEKIANPRAGVIDVHAIPVSDDFVLDVDE